MYKNKSEVEDKSTFLLASAILSNVSSALVVVIFIRLLR